MLSKFKKIFGADKKVVSDSYIVYDKYTVDEYKKQYSDHVSITEIKLPSLENVIHFEIQKWYHSDGDQVFESDKLCTIKGGNYVLELEATLPGYIYFRQQPNVKVDPGSVVCLLLNKRVEDSSTST